MHLIQSPQREPAERPIALDVTKYALDLHLAASIDRGFFVIFKGCMDFRLSFFPHRIPVYLAVTSHCGTSGLQRAFPAILTCIDLEALLQSRLCPLRLVLLKTNIPAIGAYETILPLVVRPIGCMLTFWTAPSTWSDRSSIDFVRKIVQLRAVRPFSKRFCTKNHTTPSGPAVFQAILYEKSYNSERSGRFPSGFVRKIVQLRAVRPFSKRFCTKNRTTPSGPAVFQAVLYEKSYNSERSGRFPSGFVRKIVQLRTVRPFSKRFCTKNRTTPSGPAIFQAILYEISYNSVRTANSKVKSIIV